ncbi:vitellogenin-2-like [Tachypleus tridentatus]|uniref:vitellogenin-2-like n=1 Tax=Tachypleus tridentatus TaxID=6853 RepID=UPI003FD2816C
MIPLHTHSRYPHHPFSECIGCSKGYETDSILAKSYSHTVYNVSGTFSNMTIQQIYNYGKIVYPAYGNELEIFSLLNLTLRSVTPSSYGSSKFQTLQSVTLTNLTFHLPQQIVSHPTDNIELSTWTGKVLKHRKSRKEYKLGTNSSLDIPFMSIFSPINLDDVKNTAIETLESLADDISKEDLSNSESISYKVIGLINALSVMPFHHIKALVEEVISETATRREYEKHQIMRKLLLDALPQSGSNPAVHIIVYLIEHKLVTVNEARELVEGIPQNVVYPSEHTINEIFTLIQNPEVQAHRSLFSSASIAFGKLVHRACLTPKAWPSSYPHSVKHDYSDLEVSSFFGISPQQSHAKTMFHTAVCSPQHAIRYIEKVAYLLESTREFYKKITYIELLSHITHPSILSYLKPYLIYKSPRSQSLHINESNPEATWNFLRQVTIYALHHIIHTHPREVLPLMLPIYFNPEEPYEIRIAAFSVILYSKPPIYLLERVVSELWGEENKQVSSFVYTALVTMSNSTFPCYQELAQNIRYVVGSIRPVELGIQYSHFYQTDIYDASHDYGFQFLYESIRSNVSFWPRSGYLAALHNTGPFIDIPIEIGFASKGLDQLFNILNNSDILSNLYSTYPRRDVIHEEIQRWKEKINLEVREPEEFIATFFYKLFDRTSYLELDTRYVIEILESAYEWLRYMWDKLNSGVSYRYVKMITPSGMYKVVPSEIGLPLLISHRNPIILSVHVKNARIEIAPASSGLLPDVLKISSHIQPTIYSSCHASGIIVNPTEHTMHGVTVYQQSHVTLPIDVSFVVVKPYSTVSISVTPKANKIFHHKSDAGTFIRRSVVAVPVHEHFLGDYIPIRTLPVPLKYDREYGIEVLGLKFHIQGVAETIWSDTPFYWSPTSTQKGLLAGLIETIVNPGKRYREFSVWVHQDHHNPITEFKATAYYNRTEYGTKVVTGYDRESIYKQYQSQEYTQYSSHFPEASLKRAYKSIYGSAYSIPSLEDSIHTMLSKVHPLWKSYKPSVTPASTLHATICDTVIVIFEGKSTVPVASVFEFTYAHRIDWSKTWTRAHLQISPFELFASPPYEVCVNGVTVYPPRPNEFYLDPSYTRGQTVNSKFEIGWGKQCSADGDIHVDYVAQESYEQLNSPIDFSGVDVSVSSVAGLSDQWPLPWYYKQCAIDTHEGKSQSLPCKHAIEDSKLLNNETYEISYRNVPQVLRNLTWKLDLFLKVYLYPYMDTNAVSVQNSPNKIRISSVAIKQLSTLPLYNFYIQTPWENTYYTKIYAPNVIPFSTVISFLSYLKEHLYYVMNYQSIRSCALMENYIRTFDDVTYPLPDTQCQYILFKDCSASHRYAISYTQMDPSTKTKSLDMTVGSHWIHVSPPVVKQSRSITINETLHHLAINETLRLDTYVSPVYIYLRSATSELPVVVIHVLRESITVEHDGKNSIIKVPPYFNGAHCGACGDNNGESYREFLSPQKCLYLDSQDFINSYAVGGHYCQQLPLPIKPVICPSPSPYVAQRGSDLGIFPWPSPVTETCYLNKTVYHRRSSNMCFSTEPVPFCRKNCAASEFHVEEMRGFHCLPIRSESTHQLIPEADVGVVSQLRNKRVDYEDSVPRPSSCSSFY